MTFVLEKIPEQDMLRYGLRAINDRVGKVSVGNDWVIDRDRDVYLRFLTRDRESPHLCDFHLYWQGECVWLRLAKHGVGELNGAGRTEWTFWGWTPPPALKPSYPAMIQALKEALALYKDNGTCSCIAEHTAVFTNF
ncbi:MAG: hypothetical protein RI907_2161 [Pseudomonadota bacterium]|jgi:hypothetical protein